MRDKDNSLILKRPFYYDFIIEDGSIYFPLANYNALCKGNLLNDQVDILDIFPGIPLNKRVSYTGIYKYRDYILFSYMGEDIIVYDIVHCNFFRLEGDRKVNFSSSTVYEKDKYLYVVSTFNGGVYRIDFNEASIVCVTPMEYIGGNSLVGEVIRVGDVIFIPLNQKRLLVEFDMEKESFKYHEVPDNISLVNTLNFAHDRFWITGSDKKLYTWNIRDNEVIICNEFTGYVKLFYQEKIWFGNSVFYNNTLWLFPGYADNILKYNLLTKQFEKIEIEGEEEIEGDPYGGRFFKIKYRIIQKCDNKIYFTSSKTRILYELNLKTDYITKHLLNAKNIDNNQIDPSPEGGLMLEQNYTNGLGCLIKNLTRKNVNKSMSKTKKEVCGKSINNYINNKGYNN